MAGAKEVRTKIASVKSTQKITRAMELVAASKMKKAQDNMLRSKPYATKILQVISHLATADVEFEHPYLTANEGNNIGVIVMSSDRGLCGGLNVNLFKTVANYSASVRELGGTLQYCIIGNKAQTFFKANGGNVVAFTNGLGDHPSMESLVGSVKILLDDYLSGKINKIVVMYNRFVNTMTQAPELEQLLPLTADKLTETQKTSYSWDYIYEPDPAALLEQLVLRFVESRTYQALVENIACEQAARMVAMKSATDNAGDMIKELQLVYNKARQASITQELAEIVGGASAV